MLGVKAAKVAGCEVSECAYNKALACHAVAVTVGDTHHPACVTFHKSRERGGTHEAGAIVGACKMETCAHNVLLECAIEDVSVQFHHGHADCAKYAVR